MLAPVIYMAHPVGPDGDRRVANIARAKRWLRFLAMRFPDAAIVAPWLPYVEVLTEEHRDRGVRDDLRVMLSCATAIALCGGEISPGMQAELLIARARGMTVLDLIDLGDEPPEVSTTRDAKLERERCRRRGDGWRSGT